MADIADPSGLTIRRARTADAVALTHVAARLFAETFSAANTAEDMRAFLTETYTADRQRAELADIDRGTWIVESTEGEVLGFALVHRGASSDGVVAERPMEVQRLYVDRTLHGRGAGAALMDTCMAQCAAWGCDVIWLAVWEKNPRAIAFYEKHGFRKVGSQQFRLGSDIQCDDVMMRRVSSPE